MTPPGVEPLARSLARLKTPPPIAPEIIIANNAKRR